MTVITVRIPDPQPIIQSIALHTINARINETLGRYGVSMYRTTHLQVPHGPLAADDRTVEPASKNSTTGPWDPLALTGHPQSVTLPTTDLSRADHAARSHTYMPYLAFRIGKLSWIGASTLPLTTALGRTSGRRLRCPPDKHLCHSGFPGDTSGSSNPLLPTHDELVGPTMRLFTILI